MKRDYIVLQVRLNSTRLPGKLLFKLKGITIFEHILIRLLHAKLPKGIVVATTNNTFPWIKDIIEEYRVNYLIGPEEDVLKRYALVIEKYKIDNVIRATGDNPLVCIEYVDKTIELHHKENADLTTFPDLPYGTGVEVVKASTLLEADRLTHEPLEREHITQYIYHHDDKYRVVKAIPEKKFQLPNLRLTVDTVEDFKFVENIYNTLWKGEPILLEDVIKHLRGKEIIKGK